MCGIAAVVGGAAGRAGIILPMVDAMDHRGPDERGQITVPGCTLGHARLRILDLATGGQPMSDAKERYWIAFNGEIYNFRDLRVELERNGHTFCTRSDTEVIIAAYDEWGHACLDRFRGMFSFALWDTQERTLFAARDLFGEKPLYFASQNDGTLVIASEIRAIVASRLTNRPLDLQSIDAFLAYGYVPPERTIYEDVDTVPPAHYLTWRDGRTELTAYWEPSIGHAAINLNEAAEELRPLTERAVKRQMLADVPLGAFLSGGLDSSTVVALMQSQSSRPVKTFSVGFGTMINELPYARAVARRYGTEHHEIDVGDVDAAALIDKMARVYDEPFADTSNIPTFLVAQYARQFVTVALTGDGGDEMFGGYDRYGTLQRSESMRLPIVQWLALRTASVVLRDRWRSLREISQVAAIAARADDVWTRDVMVHTIIPAAERQRLWGVRGSRRVPYEPLGYRPDTSVEGLDRAFYFDVRCYLAGDILAKVDRAAMANSLETRAPFLDRDVAEFALSLPATLKVSKGQGKVVMRRAFADLWPEEIRNRPKEGFGSPISQWLAQPAVRERIEQVAAPASLLRALLPGITRADFHRPNYAAWILLTLGVWLETHQQTRAMESR
jgi:asparagine synthase (glutamine-hydrolysing)